MRGKRARSSSGLSSEDPDTRHTDDASDIEIPLCKFLNGIESGGSFATTGVYSQAPLPDLFLQGYGPIPLPLAQRGFDEICEEQTEDHTGKRHVETSDVMAEERSCRRMPPNRAIQGLGCWQVYAQPVGGPGFKFRSSQSRLECICPENRCQNCSGSGCQAGLKEGQSGKAQGLALVDWSLPAAVQGVREMAT